jgi:hypothetical protein
MLDVKISRLFFTESARSEASILHGRRFHRP